MKSLSGAKLRITKPATKRDAFYLDGAEISRAAATELALAHVGAKTVSDALRAVHFRDCTDTPTATARGVYCHALVSITEPVA